MTTRRSSRSNLNANNLTVQLSVDFALYSLFRHGRCFEIDKRIRRMSLCFDCYVLNASILPITTPSPNPTLEKISRSSDSRTSLGKPATNILVDMILI